VVLKSVVPLGIATDSFVYTIGLQWRRIDFECKQFLNNDGNSDLRLGHPRLEKVVHAGLLFRHRPVSRTGGLSRDPRWSRCSVCPATRSAFISPR
jgi:hypothetical protein